MTKPGYPHRGFLSDAVEAHFASFEREQLPGADLVCIDTDSGVRWIIQIKGGSGRSASELRAGLGELLTQMRAGPRANYVLVLPDTPAFTRERELVPQWTQEALNLWWFVVDDAGEVNAIPPLGPVDAQRLREDTARETARAMSSPVEN
jgi:hypothetical protein